MKTLQYGFLALLASAFIAHAGELAISGEISYQDIATPTATTAPKGGLLSGNIDTPKNPSAFMKNFGLMGSIRTQDGEIEEFTIADVPAYLWYHGSAPTAAASIIGYLDANGYPGLMPGGYASMDSVEGDFAYQSIASDQHYEDYSLPIDSAGAILQDKSQLGNAHESNSIADFMGTSFSSLGQFYGSTSINQLILGLATYFVYQYPELSVSYYQYAVTQNTVSDTYEALKLYIHANIPIMLTVNSDDGIGDNIVAVIGYRHNTLTGQRQYIAYNGYDKEQHIYDYLPALNYISEDNYTVNYGAYRVAAIQFINPDRNLYRQPVYYYYRPAVGSYFFTANEPEKQVLDASPNFQLQGVSHRVYSQRWGESFIPVYRFLNNLGSHFYTATESEKDTIIANLSHIYTLEGVAFYVFAGPVGGAKPVYRFFQPSTRSHFFTIDEAEKERRILEDPTMRYEGIAWYAFSD